MSDKNEQNFEFEKVLEDESRKDVLRDIWMFYRYVALSIPHSFRLNSWTYLHLCVAEEKKTERKNIDVMIKEEHGIWRIQYRSPSQAILCSGHFASVTYGLYLILLLFYFEENYY